MKPTPSCLVLTSILLTFSPSIVLSQAPSQTLSQTLSQTNSIASPQSLQTRPIDTNDFVCYMRTSDGQVLNLSQWCGLSSKDDRPTTAPAIDANANLGGLAGSNGNNTCFIFDANGQPCPPVQ